MILSGHAGRLWYVARLVTAASVIVIIMRRCTGLGKVVILFFHATFTEVIQASAFKALQIEDNSENTIKNSASDTSNKQIIF